MLQSCSLDKGLLGQRCPWTNVPWTNVSKPNSGGVHLFHQFFCLGIPQSYIWTSGKGPDSVCQKWREQCLLPEEPLVLNAIKK